MDLDRPFVAALFVLATFLAPLLFALGLFLFLVICSLVTRYVPEPRPYRLRRREYVAGSDDFKVVGYVRISSHSSFNEEKVSWKNEICLGARPVKTDADGHGFCVRSAAGGCWRGTLPLKASSEQTSSE